MSDTVGKVITCRAAVAWEPKKPLTIEEIQVEPPKAHEVRIKIIATGVCHTDATALNDDFRGATVFPTILGHEGAGIVESVGEGVTKVKAGDHVIPLYIAQCDNCKICKNPKSNFCQTLNTFLMNGNMPDGTSRFSCRGKKLHHFMGCSTFAEYTVVSDLTVTKINEKAPLEKVCLIGCGIPTGYGAAINTGGVKPGDVCAVWGLGGVGLGAVMGCKKAGASKIYGIDINPGKAELAKIFGMTDFLNPNDYKDKPFQEVIRELTAGGLDVAIECIGTVQTLRCAFESSSISGTTVAIGVVPTGQELSINPFNLLNGRILRGSIFGGWKSVTAVPKLVDEYLKKELLVDEFITHTMGLDKINEAFDLMRDGKSIRSVVEFKL